MSRAAVGAEELPARADAHTQHSEAGFDVAHVERGRPAADCSRVRAGEAQGAQSSDQGDEADVDRVSVRRAGDVNRLSVVSSFEFQEIPR